MNGRRTRMGAACLLTIWLGAAGVAGAVGLGAVDAARAQPPPEPATATADSQTTAGSVQTEAAQTTDDVPARGAGRRGRGGRKRLLLAQLMTLLTLAAAAGAAYAVYYVRKLRATIPRLQDAISGQARQLAELRRQLADRVGSGSVGGAGGGPTSSGARGSSPGR